MGMKEGLLCEFEYEFAITRRFLELYPEDKGDWKPHAKSMSLRDLARHLAEIVSWYESVLLDSGFDIPAGFKENQSNTAAELVAFVDEHKVKAVEAFKKFNPDSIQDPWKLSSEGQVYFEMPRIAVLEAFCNKHTVHHRAQLGVYYRMLDIPVPATYGPSADEQNPPSC